LLNLISQEHLRPGEPLATEADLSKQLRASRSTVRGALKSLEQEGLINVIRGHGRFISGVGALNVERPVTKYESTTEMLQSRGFAVSSAVLDVREDRATQLEADALAIEKGDAIIRLLRIRYGDDRPLVFSLTVILREALPGPLEHRDWGGSLTSALEAHGQLISSSAARITASDLPKDMERRYKLAGLGPWLQVEETALSRSGQRIVYAREYYRGGHIAFSVLRRR
jgi:DNA-binding GntR family transcriptional regulator